MNPGDLVVEKKFLESIRLAAVTEKETALALVKVKSPHLLRVDRVSKDGNQILLEERVPSAFTRKPGGGSVRRWFAASDFFQAATSEEMVALSLMGF